MAELAPIARQRFFDSNGDPLVGGLLYTYEAGTTTPRATFKDFAGVEPNTNPVVLDSNGYAQVRVVSGAYKFVLKTAEGSDIWTEDNIQSLSGLINIAGALAVNNNLSDVPDKDAARSNLEIGNIDNTSDVDKPVSTAQQTALDLKANLASPTFTGTVGGVTKSMVGLSNADDTSDADKPVSSAQQTALDSKVDILSPSLANPDIVTGANIINNGYLRFLEGSGNGSNYVSLKAPSALAGNLDFTLPLQDGGAGEFMRTDGSGVLSFATISITDTVEVNTASFTAVSNRFYKVSSASAVTITLPASPASGDFIVVTKTSSDFNTITLTGASAVHTQGESIKIRYDGSAWYVQDRYIPGGSVSFTPTGLWTGAVTYTGSLSRIGDKALFLFSAYCTSGPSGAGSFGFNIPTGITVDTSKLIGSSSEFSAPFGVTRVLDSGVSVYDGTCAYSTASSRVNPWWNKSGTTSNVTVTSPIVFGTADTVTCEIKLPITGWNG